MKNLLIVTVLLLATLISGCKSEPTSAAIEEPNPSGPSIASVGDGGNPQGFSCQANVSGWVLRYAATFETVTDPITQEDVQTVRVECAAYEQGSQPSSIIRTHAAPSESYDNVSCVITLDDSNELFTYSADLNGARGAYSDDSVTGLEVEFEADECEAQ